MVGGNATGWLATPQAAWSSSEQQFGSLLLPHYGGLKWTPFTLSTGATGYNASGPGGGMYYFGPDNKLYLDSYSGEVHASDVAANLLGDVTTYDFSSSSGTGDGIGDGSGSGSGTGTGQTHL